MNRFFVVALAAGLVAGIGCGDATTPGFDAEEDQSEGDTSVDNSQTITFVTPDPAERKLVSGVYKVEFKYQDPLNLPASLTISFVSQPAFTPIVIEAPKSGTYSVDVDTRLVPDGKRSVQVTALASDQRTITAKGKVLVDNNAPLISVLEPTPVEDSNFIQNLVVRVKVTDDGNQVHKVRITARDFEWTWPAKEGDTSDVVDTRVVDGETYTDLTIPTLDWTGGSVTFRVTADDGIQGHDSEVEYDIRYVEVPGFVGGEALPLPTGTAATMIAGIRLGPADDGIWGVAVAEGNAGLSIYQRASAKVLQPVGQVSPLIISRFLVADMDDDGMDDIVAYCVEADQKKLAIFIQQVDLTFLEAAVLPLSAEVVNLAAGPLNNDDFPDIAFTSSDDVFSTGIVLSVSSDLGDLETWGEPDLYSGAVNPESITIGRLYNNTRNAVVVGRRDDGIVTLFPVNEDGVSTSGENSTIDPLQGNVKGVTSLASVNFSNIDGVRDTILYTDIDGEETLGVAQMNATSLRLEKRVSWPTGIDPVDMAVGDIDGNNVIDVAVLCSGANMVEIFMGNPNQAGTNFVRPGIAMLAGAARDVTLADLDGEGHLDVVLLDREGSSLVMIAYETSEKGNRFVGSYQAVLGSPPLSVQVGHFTAPLAGAGADFLDAAALLGQTQDSPAHVSVFASDSVIGMPILPAGTVAVDLMSPRKILVANLNTLLFQSSEDTDARPDDLIVTSGDDLRQETETSYYPTALSILFIESTHTSVSSSTRGAVYKKAPEIATVNDFDRLNGGGDYRVNDLAYIWRVEALGDTPASWQLSSEIGQMNGSFLPKTSTGGLIGPIEITEDRAPVAMESFPMRRTLFNYTSGTAGEVDLVVANGGTFDFTVFVSQGVGSFKPKTQGSRDFALGGAPKDIAVGYLRNPTDGTAPVSEANNQLPDVVALLDDKLVVLYSIDNDGLRELGEAVGLTVGFEPPLPVEFPGSFPIDVELADMNGDAFLDIVVLDRDASMVWIYVNLAQRKFSAPFGFDTGTMPLEMFIADVDADGCRDIVTADSTGMTLTTLRNTSIACLE